MMIIPALFSNSTKASPRKLELFIGTVYQNYQTVLVPIVIQLLFPTNKEVDKSYSIS